MKTRINQEKTDTMKELEDMCSKTLVFHILKS